MGRPQNIQNMPQKINIEIQHNKNKNNKTMNNDDVKEGNAENEEQHENQQDSTKNPWFNDEIAEIVKLHRKTIRKFHRSKTKKKELKKKFFFKGWEKKKKKKKKKK